MAADLEGLRRELGIESIDLLGHGLGEAVAILYADRHPERVGRLIILGGGRRASSFLDGPGLLERMTPEMKSALRSSGSDRYLSADGRLRERLRILAPLMFYRLTDRSFQRAFVDQMTLSADVREAMSAGLDARDGSGGFDAVLARLKIPILIVAGRHDPTTPVSESETLRRAIPGSQLEILEESGSFPFAEQPVEFLKIVKKFFEAGVDGAGGGI